MKKIVTLLLAIAMLCGLAAFAEEAATDTEMCIRDREYGDSISYDNLGPLEQYAWGYSNLEPVGQTAWEFMIEQVHKYPGQVTIMAVGACTNVALAILNDPTFAENTAGIYYMGGSIDVPGNDTPCAERNWYYDPEAVDVLSLIHI